jgi:hypothetical protein
MDNPLVLEHEMVHAIQHERYPGMPIVLREFDAYYSESRFPTDPYYFRKSVYVDLVSTIMSSLSRGE